MYDELKTNIARTARENKKEKDISTRANFHGK